MPAASSVTAVIRSDLMAERFADQLPALRAATAKSEKATQINLSSGVAAEAIIIMISEVSIGGA